MTEYCETGAERSGAVIGSYRSIGVSMHAAEAELIFPRSVTFFDRLLLQALLHAI